MFANIETAVVAKLKAEGLSLSSPWPEIESCLRNTVAPTKCLATAFNLRETRQFTCEFIGSHQGIKLYFYPQAELAPYVADYPNGTYQYFTTLLELWSAVFLTNQEA